MFRHTVVCLDVLRLCMRVQLLSKSITGTSPDVLAGYGGGSCNRRGYGLVLTDAGSPTRHNCSSCGSRCTFQSLDITQDRIESTHRWQRMATRAPCLRNASPQLDPLGLPKRFVVYRRSTGQDRGGSPSWWDPLGPVLETSVHRSARLSADISNETKGPSSEIQDATTHSSSSTPTARGTIPVTASDFEANSSINSQLVRGNEVSDITPMCAIRNRQPSHCIVHR